VGDKEEGEMSEIKFREILKDDLEDVFLLLNQLKEKDVNTIDLESAWKSFKSNSSSNSIVGIYNDKVIAYGSIVIENKIRGDIAGHIEDIVVDNTVRGKMVGVKLVKELVDIGKTKGCYRITLFCDEKLIKFYERNGFKVNNIMMKSFLNN
jgi:glucosamine-phosphate N-acetyltransferase